VLWLEKVEREREENANAREKEETLTLTINHRKTFSVVPTETDEYRCKEQGTRTRRELK
jgi:hypothetical protein